MFCYVIPVCPAHWPRGKTRNCGRSLAGNVVSNPAGAWMSCEYFALSGKGLCGGPITRPEESYRVCVSLCDLETSTMRRPWPMRAAESWKKILYFIIIYFCFVLDRFVFSFSRCFMYA